MRALRDARLVALGGVVPAIGLGLAIGLLVAGCGTAATPTPTPLPTAIPAPTLTPMPVPPAITIGELGAACRGEAVAYAAPYAGDSHPLVLLDDNGGWEIWTNESLHDFVFLPPLSAFAPKIPLSAEPGYNDPNVNSVIMQMPANTIQLVVCHTAAHTVLIESCGDYTRNSDGKTGELLRKKWTEAVRLVVAETGATLQEKNFDGPPPDPCSPQMRGPQGGDPPWEIVGDSQPPSHDDVFSLMTGLSRDPAP